MDNRQHVLNYDTCRTKRGFSLVELLVVIGIIIALGAASIQGMKAATQIPGRKGAVSLLLGMFEQARAHAIRYSTDVYVIFADQQVTSEFQSFRYRTVAIWGSPDGDQAEGYLSKWESLPKGVSFKNEAKSLIQSTNPAKKFLFPNSDTTSSLISLPHVKFNSMGVVEHPVTENLNVYLFDGFVGSDGKEQFTTSLGDQTVGGKYFDWLKLTKFSGRARYMTSDEADFIE